jgi:exodeoxyribonuclease VII large subunit
LRQRAQQLDDVEARLIRVLRHALSSRGGEVRQLAAHLRQHSPALRVAAAQGRLAIARSTLRRSARANVERLRGRFAAAASMLNAMSPLATLQRGYAIVSDDKDRVVISSKSVKPGQRIRARLAEGEIQARVESAYTGENRQLELPTDDEP